MMELLWCLLDPLPNEDTFLDPMMPTLGAAPQEPEADLTSGQKTPRILPSLPRNLLVSLLPLKGWL